MLRTLTIGFLVTIAAMLPYLLTSFVTLALRRRFARQHGFRPEDFDPELHADLAAEMCAQVDERPGLRVAFVLSLLLVYPSLIGNAIFHVDTLRLWFVFVCCYAVYTPLAYLLLPH